MKLLVISAAYPPHRSGEATNAFYLCQNLADRGVDVHILTSQGCTHHVHPRISLYPVMKHWSWSEMPRLAMTLKHCAPDAVLLIYLGWVYQYQFMVTFAPTLSKKLLPGVPFVTRFENAMGADPRYTSLFSRAVRKLMAWMDSKEDVDYCYGTLLRDSDRIIVLSERHRLLLSQISSDVAGKSVLIPPCPNMHLSIGSAEVARFRGRRHLGISDDAFLIMYIGFLHRGKGLESLLRAFALLGKRRTNIQLVLMGGAIAPESGNPSVYVETLYKLAASLGISDRVTWTGEYFWDSENTSLSLYASDVCVLPFSQGVHLNNSSFASVAAHGIPVITTRGEFLEEQFIHGENVYLCPPDSPESLATAIATLAEDMELRHRLRCGIEKLARAWFSWEQALDQTVAACIGSTVAGQLLEGSGWRN